jgi:hypothetical protein
MKSSGAGLVSRFNEQENSEVTIITGVQPRPEERLTEQGFHFFCRAKRQCA